MSSEQNDLNSPSLLPPAAKTLFIKRVLDSQKFFIGKVYIILFFPCFFLSSHLPSFRAPLCTFVAKNRRWIWDEKKFYNQERKN